MQQLVVAPDAVARYDQPPRRLIFAENVRNGALPARLDRPLRGLSHFIRLKAAAREVDDNVTVLVAPCNQPGPANIPVARARIRDCCGSSRMCQGCTRRGSNAANSAGIEPPSARGDQGALPNTHMVCVALICAGWCRRSATAALCSAVRSQRAVKMMPGADGGVAWATPPSAGRRSISSWC
jgi:hypothetical protein